MQSIYNSGVKNAFICIGFMGNSSLRERIYYRLKEIGFNIPNVIDPSAIIASDVKLGEGIFVGKNAIINTSAMIEEMVIINTSAIVEHDAVVKKYSHISVGAVLCGNVNIGKCTLVGASSTVIQGISIGDNTVIGASSVVVSSVGDNKKAYGVPCKEVDVNEDVNNS